MNRKLLTIGVVLFTMLSVGCGSAFAFGNDASIKKDSPIHTTSSSHAGRTVGAVGFGTASAPAESVTIQFIIGQDSYYHDGPTPPEWEPDVATEEAIQQAVDALIGAGVSEDAIEVGTLPFGPYGPGAATEILVSVDYLDHEVIQSLTEPVYRVLGPSGFFVLHLGAAYHTSDCEAMVTEARLDAIQYAEQQAGLLAQTLEVELDGWHSVVEYPYFGFTNSGECGQSPDPHGMNYFPPLYDLQQQPAEVQVTVHLEATFAVK